MISEPDPDRPAHGIVGLGAHPASPASGEATHGDDLSLEVARLRDEVRALRAELAATARTRPLSVPDADEAPPAAPRDPTPPRRAALRTLGMAAAGALGAGIAGAQPAAANDGDPVRIGQLNAGSSTDTVTTLSGGFLVMGGVSTAVAAATLQGINSSTQINAVGVLGAVSPIFGGTNIGYGVVGQTEVGGAGVNAISTKATPAISAGLRAFSQAGPTMVLGGAVTGKPATGTWPRGAVVADTAGRLWYCVTGGNPGEWRQLTGPTTGSVTPCGALQLLTTTTRIYDSRTGPGIFNNATRTISAPSPVPPGAQAILINLAVTQTNGAGYGALFTGPPATWPGNASINWSAPNTTISNMAVVAVNAAGQFQCKVDGQAHVIVDLVGFYA